MQQLHPINLCPICNSSTFNSFLTTNDYAQSEESFQLIECSTCHFLITSPRPDLMYLSAYYKKRDYISHSDSGKGFLNKMYRRVRSYTLKKKIQSIKQYLPHGTVLDIGSGAGYFVNACETSGFKAIGIEPDEQTRVNSISQFKIKVYDESKLDEMEDSSFNLITLWHVLEHVPDLAKRMSQIVRLLKSDGYIWIALPNPNAYDAWHYQEHWAAYDVPRHLWHFRPKNIIHLAENYNLKLVKVLPMYFDAFYVSLLSEKYKKSAFGLIKGFLHAAVSNLNASIKAEPLYSSQIYIFKK